MISVIIIDYNTIDRTVRFINDFSKKCIGEKCHYIVMDNYSCGNTLELIKQKKAAVENIGSYDRYDLYNVETDNISFVYCRAGENLGYARGNNLGSKIADHLFHDDLFLFSNNDIIFPSAINLKRIERIFSVHTDIAAIGPRVTGLDGCEQSPNKKLSSFRQLIGNYWAYMLPFCESNGALDFHNRSQYCFWVSGCFFFVNANSFRKVNGFDEHTFLYGEEMMLSEKFIRLGYKELFLNDIQIIHEGGATTKKSYLKSSTAKMTFNSYCYYQKQYHGVSDLYIKTAKINFKLFEAVCKLKGWIRSLLR